jgi:hypothetical protein
MIRHLLAAFSFLLVLGHGASAQTCSVPNTLANGTNADATQVMANFNALQSCVRDRLTANRTYFVRTDGNDACNGLTNAAGSSGACAFLTIQKAVDVIATLDISANNVTVQVADGTYAGVVALKNVQGFAGPGNLVIQGNNGTPANVVMNVTGTAFTADSLNVVWDIKDMKLTTTLHGIQTKSGSKVRFGNLNFGAGNVHLFADSGSQITALSGYTISGNATGHWESDYGSTIRAAGITITTAGTPAIGLFAQAAASGNIAAFNNTYSGTGATGARYSAIINGAIVTLCGNTTCLPGNAASGTPTATGGQYIQ